LNHRRPSAHRKIDRVGVGRPFPRRAQALGLKELHAERVGDAGDGLDLQGAELPALALEPVRPDMRAGLGRNELRVDRDRLADAPHAPFERVAHVEVAAELLCVDRLALIGERGLVRDHEAAGQMREVGGEIVGEAVGEIILLGVAAEVGERQDDDRHARRLSELLVRDCGC
jgi:hypothetical protein